MELVTQLVVSIILGAYIVYFDIVLVLSAILLLFAMHSCIFHILTSLLFLLVTSFVLVYNWLSCC